MPLSPQTRITTVLFIWVTVLHHLKMSESNNMELQKFMMSLLTVCTVFQSASRDNAYHNFGYKILNHLGYLVSSESTLPLFLSSHGAGISCDS